MLLLQTSSECDDGSWCVLRWLKSFVEEVAAAARGAVVAPQGLVDNLVEVAPKFCCNSTGETKKSQVRLR